MARISTYVQDENITAGDKLLGSDIGGATRNFDVSDIAKFLSNTNAHGVAGCIPYKYVTTLVSGGMKVVSSSSSELSFPTGNDIVLRVSKYPNGQQNRSTVAVLNTYVGKEIITSQVQDPNVFAVYKVESVEQEASSDYYNITMHYLNGNNNSDGKGFLLNLYYNLTPYIGAQDKDFNLPFTTGDLTQDGNEYYLLVNHNLGKYPNLTVKISTGAIVEVPIKHITNNQSRVYFKGLNSGTVYAN
tara:strand:- start:2225 stop:2956 length:732 start_codon:yes stop_codon:yes gene_type:complete